MNLRRLLNRSAAAGAAILLLPGCIISKPTADPTRFFVLSSLPEADAAPSTTRTDGAALQIRPVTIPGYLQSSALAIERAPQEIHYAEWDRWAERLDRGFQRVLARNLALLLPGRCVRLSRGKREPGASELQVTVQRFEVDASGRGFLAAQWWVASTADGKLERSGEGRFTRQGPSPTADPRGAVASLSELLGEFARDLARQLGTQAPAS